MAAGDSRGNAPGASRQSAQRHSQGRSQGHSRGVAAVCGVIGCALLVAGCTEPGPPDVMIFADGETISVEPETYCDVHVTECSSGEQEGNTLRVRPGEPAQISVPGEIADSPWLVNVQSVDTDGDPLPVEQEFFTPGESYAFTAQPPSEDARLLVVEIQQLGATYAVDEGGDVLLDEDGSVQPVARGIWPVEFHQGP